MPYKIALLLLFVFMSSKASNAGLCTRELQEKANVFEVNCAMDKRFCEVNGYMSSNLLKTGYSGNLAFFNKHLKN